MGRAFRMSKADEYIPEFTKGESIPIASLSLPEGKTSPPEYLTEAELIGLMVMYYYYSPLALSTRLYLAFRNKMVLALMQVFLHISTIFVNAIMWR